MLSHFRPALILLLGAVITSATFGPNQKHEPRNKLSVKEALGAPQRSPAWKPQKIPLGDGLTLVIEDS